MHNLSQRIMGATFSEIDDYLLEALKEVELIGELPLTEEAFEYICQKLRYECVLNNKIQLKRLKLAPFLVSMVFSARYSNDMRRSFWKPYAAHVWQIPYSNTFYNCCRSYYFDAKQWFTDHYGFEFPAINEKGVVRAIYWHTILPAYLHDDFAQWLKKNIKPLMELQPDTISERLNDPATTRYVAPRLQQFLTHEDTRDAALELISVLTEGFELLSSGEHENEIAGLLPSLIQKEIWWKFYAELEPEDVDEKRAYRAPKLEWVWSLEYDTWILRLSRFKTPPDKEPVLCIWSHENANEAFWNHINQTELWPTRHANDDWHISETEIGWLDNDSALDAPDSQVFIYDRQDENIHKLSVPALPNDTMLFYRITQQSQYAVPIRHNQISEGRFLLSYSGKVTLYDQDDQPISPHRTLQASSVMRDTINHEIMQEYELKLPLQIVSSEETIHLASTKSRNLPTPVLLSNHQIEHLSNRVPPAFSSNAIYLFFPNLATQTHSPLRQMKLKIETPQKKQYEPLLDVGKFEGDDFVIDIAPLLSDTQIATYLFDVTYGLQSRLSAPIELSVIPDIEIVPPDLNTIFDPLNCPTAQLLDVSGTVSAPRGTTISSKGNAYSVTWEDLREEHCRLNISGTQSTVSLAWKIKRIFAWVEKNSTLPKKMVPEDLEHTILEFRGPPRYNLSLHVGNQMYQVTLNARGEHSIPIRRTALYDIIQEQPGAVVPITLSLAEGSWILTTLERRPQVTQAQVDYLTENGDAFLAIDARLSKHFDAEFRVQIMEQQTHRVIHNETVPNLTELHLIECDLPTGTYTVKLLANGDSLELPEQLTFDVSTPILANFSVDYDHDEHCIHLRYEIDNVAPGDYAMVLENEFGQQQITAPIDKAETRSSVRANLDTGTYHLSIHWDDSPIGDSITLSVQDTDKISIADADGPETVDKTQFDWFDRIAMNPPATLDATTKYKLATLSSEQLQSHSMQDLASLWSPLAPMAMIHQTSAWIQQHGFIPSCALLDYPLAMITNEDQSYLVFPEYVFQKGMSGIGKIAIHTPQEGEIYGYARWSHRNNHTARLHVWIPPSEPEVYAELDELNMWPAYYDRLSGEFHGSRTKPLSPGRQEGAFLVDCAHNYTLRVRVRQSKHRLLRHTIDATTLFDRSYLRAIIRNDFASVEHLHCRATHITDAPGYRYAVRAWLKRCVEQADVLKRTQSLVGVDSPFDALADRISKLARRARQEGIPLFVGAGRFLRLMESQIRTIHVENELMQLDRNLFLLAVLLRSQALHTPNSGNLLQQFVESNEQKWIDLTHEASETCPELLEWALTWAELCLAHSAI